MKFLRPTPTKSTSANAKPASFGAARAERMQHRLELAQEQRQKLVRAEFGSDDPLTSVYQQKGGALDREIERLKKDS